MKKKTSKHLSVTQMKYLHSLVALPDAKINTKDIAEVRNWAGAQRGPFYRPVKYQLTLRREADIIA